VSDFAALSAADLQALRLATQVFRHKAAMQARPVLERYWADLGRQVDFGLAQRGIGFVVGTPIATTLDDSATDEDRRMLDEQLRLLADNEQLPGAVREACAALRQRVAA
jgi:hypothetical protein